ASGSAGRCRGCARVQPGRGGGPPCRGRGAARAPGHLPAHRDRRSRRTAGLRTKGMLIDSHCHLNYAGLAENEADVAARARAAGVQVMLTINTRLSEFDAVRDIAHRHDDVFCTVGVHPHEAEKASATVAEIVSRTADPRVVGIGETGLDYYYDHSPRDL